MSFLVALRRGWWGALGLSLLLIPTGLVSAQIPLRGPPLASRQTAPPVIAAPTAVPFPGAPIPASGLTPSGRVPVQLMPGKPTINLLNNGSLQVSQNPNSNFPNSLPYSYIASLPLGDRLTLNGIQTDPQLIPQIGVGINGPGGAPRPNGPGANPGQPVPGQPIPGQPIPGQPIPGQPRFFGAYASRAPYAFAPAMYAAPAYMPLICADWSPYFTGSMMSTSLPMGFGYTSFGTFGNADGYSTATDLSSFGTGFGGGS